jgi:hypothetical protein
MEFYKSLGVVNSAKRVGLNNRGYLEENAYKLLSKPIHPSAPIVTKADLLDPLGGQHVHKMVKFETGRKPPLSMPECGIAGGYVWEQSPRPSNHHAFGFFAIPIIGNQGEWCDITATTPNTRIVSSCDVR